MQSYPSQQPQTPCTPHFERIWAASLSCFLAANGQQRRSHVSSMESIEGSRLSFSEAPRVQITPVLQQLPIWGTQEVRYLATHPSLQMSVKETNLNSCQSGFRPTANTEAALLVLAEERGKPAGLILLNFSTTPTPTIMRDLWNSYIMLGP